MQFIPPPLPRGTPCELKGLRSMFLINSHKSNDEPPCLNPQHPTRSHREAATGGVPRYPFAASPHLIHALPGMMDSETCPLRNASTTTYGTAH